METINTVSKAVRECKNQVGVAASSKGLNHQYLILKQFFNINPVKTAVNRVRAAETPRVTQMDLPKINVGSTCM